MRVRFFGERHNPIMMADGEGDGGAGGAAPGPVPVAAAPEPAPTPEPAPAEPTAAAPTAPTPAPVLESPAAPARPDWKDARLAKQTAKLREAEETAAAATRQATESAAELARYRQQYGAQPPVAGAPAPTAAVPSADRLYTKAELDIETARAANIKVLNDKCEQMFDAGASQLGDQWKQRVAAAQNAFGEDLRQRPDFFEALTTLPNSAAVYSELAGDLNHFAEVLALSPTRLGMELAQLSVKVGNGPSPRQVSQAPAPITPIDGNASGGDGSDLGSVKDMGTYVKIRERQREERFARGGSR